MYYNRFKPIDVQLVNMLNVNEILQAGGVLAVAAILFAETGLLVGFFLPGDTLLIAAGIFAADKKIHLLFLLPAAAIAAIVGYQVAYKIGEHAGPRLFRRKGGVLFRDEYIDKTEEMVRRYGIRAILIARFIVVVRTIVPLIAGMGKMDKRRFLIINILGGVLWTTSVILASYWVGSKIPNIDHYIVLLLVLAMVLTSGSVLYGLLKSRSKRKELVQALREEIGYLFNGKKTK